MKHPDQNNEVFNGDLTSIVTPVKIELLVQLLNKFQYDKVETEVMVSGFRHGFSLEYDGPMKQQDLSDNIPLREIGTKQDLWEKIMKGVRLQKVADSIPFDSYVQSPVGLVPKFFQRFSNALAFLTSKRLASLVIDRGISNYLDGFLNITLSKEACNLMLQKFHELCSELQVPLAKEKTVWASMLVVFLGILLDGDRKLLALPLEKIDKAIYQLKMLLTKKKITVQDVQSLVGLLNFMGRAVVPGRAFTRRMYAKITSIYRHTYIYIYTYISTKNLGQTVQPGFDFFNRVRMKSISFVLVWIFRQ